MRRLLTGLLRRTVVLTSSALVLASCTNDNSPTQPPARALYTTPTGYLSANPPQIFIGAGDISSCSNDGDEMTARIIDTIPGTVYNLGDDAYNNGSTSEFANCYDPTWGRFKNRTKPSAGNHEYNTSGAAPYYAYFGAAAGDPSKGYYSYNLGAWHIIVLNSNITRSAGSPQDTWLKSDLAAHPNQCTLAYWHHPLYSSTGGSGSGGTSISSMRPFWDALYAAHADLVLNGHRHFYERMAPMKPDGTRDDANGIRSIIAGSGGIGGGTVTNAFPTSQVSNGDTRGVLKLYLYDDSYAWRFIPIAGKTFTDTGSTACHYAGGGGGGGGGGVVDGAQSTVSASPTSVTTGATSTITVTVKDGNGTPISGATVVLSATGSGNTLTQPATTTNSSGVATGSLSSSVAEGKTVSATANGTAVTQTASVTVTSSGGGGGGGGSVVQSLLTSGSNAANGKVFTTAAIAPAPNALVTVAVRSRRGSGPLTPTVTGGGMSSWSTVSSVDYDAVGSPDARVVVFRAMSPAPGSGAITITFASSVSNAEWIVSQWTGVDQSGSNGSGAVGQTGTASGDGVTALSVPLAAFANANNVGYGLVGAATNGPAVTPGAGFTEIAEPSSGESTLLEAEWGTNRNTIQASLSQAANAGLLGIEIKAGASGPSVSASQSTVTASAPSFSAGGSSTITVTVKDGTGTPMSGVAVTLAATGSGNTITQPAAPTNASGIATGTLSSTGAGPKTVTATAGTVTLNQQPVVTVAAGPADGSQSTLSASPTSIVTGSGSSTITVTVKDAYGNPVSGSAVTLTASGTGNTLVQPGATDATGMTTGTLSSTDVQTETVSAKAGAVAIAQTASIGVTAPVPTVSPTLSTVVANPPSFSAGGSSTITVTVKDGGGNLMSGVAVTLSATGTGNTITQPATATDVNGVTTGSVSSTVAEPKTVTAVAGGVTLNQQPMVTVTPGPADAGQSSVSASPTSITAGTGSSTITVTVKDLYGNPVSGATVILAATGTGNTLTQPVGTTAADGIATGSLTSTTAEQKTVSAKAGALGLTQTATVTVNPPGSAQTITQALLTAGNNAANQKVYTTASIAPAANTLVLVAVLDHQASNAAPAPTVTGGGMTTWDQVATLTFDTQGAPVKRMTIFRAMSGAPGSGPITITSSVTVSNAQWIVSQFGGVDQSGANGSGAIVQTGSASGDGVDGLSVPLSAFANANDVAYGLFGVRSSVPAVTAGAGFTAISEQPSNEGTSGDLFAEWAANLTAVTASWSGLNAGALALELKANTSP
jgi:Bacterial Ig-like domain (group 1)/Invasin, domain 3